MADSAVPITAGAGTNIDTRTEATNGQHRQVVVLGDPAVNAGVAPVDATNGLAVDVKALPNEGQQTMAASISVAVASDQTAVPVSAPVAAPAFVRLSDGAAAITTLPVSIASVPSHAVTNAGTFAVQESGAALTALQLIDDVVQTEDAAHSSGDKGVMSLAIRSDAGGALAGTTGDYSPLQVDANGNLRVNIAAGAAAGGTSATDDGAFSPGVGSGTPIMGFADETTPDAVDEGDVGIVRMTLNRALHVNLRDASGAEITAGTEYTEGDVDASIGGVATLWEDTSDTLRVPSVAKPLPVQVTPVTTGGCSVFRSLDLDETEEDVKTSAGQVYGWFMSNLGAAAVYIKFYNETAANVVVGTTTPLLTIPLEPDQAANVSFPQGIAFSAAICVAATTGLADNSTTGPGANEVVVNIFYK